VSAYSTRLAAYDLTAGLDVARLSALIHAADLDSAQCGARMARNDQIRAACQLALIRVQLEEDTE
jgi:hypothetical protein